MTSQKPKQSVTHHSKKTLFTAWTQKHRNTAETQKGGLKRRALTAFEEYRACESSTQGECSEEKLWKRRGELMGGSKDGHSLESGGTGGCRFMGHK